MKKSMFLLLAFGVCFIFSGCAGATQQENSGKNAGYTVSQKGKRDLLEEKVRILRETDQDYSQSVKAGSMQTTNKDMVQVRIALKQSEAELERMKLRGVKGPNPAPADLFIQKTYKEQVLKELETQYNAKNATSSSVNLAKLEILDIELELNKYAGLAGYQKFIEAAKAWAASPDDPQLLTAMVSSEKSLVRRSEVKKDVKNPEKKTVKNQASKEKKEKSEKKEKK